MALMTKIFGVILIIVGY